MADIENKFTMDVSEVLSALDQVGGGLDQYEAKVNKVSKADPFKEAAQGAADLENELLTGAKAYAVITNSTKAFEDEIKRLNKEKAELTKRQKEFIAAGKYEKMQSDLQKINARIKELQAGLGKANREGKKTEGLFSKIKGFAAGWLIAGSGGGGGMGLGLGSVLAGINPVLGAMAGLLGTVTTKAYQAQSAWEGIEASLSVALGSMKLANKDMAILEGLAARLPVGLNELTEVFNKLVNRGFKPTAKEIANLSGLAASQNKSFDQLIEAILDAEEGEVERLKEFGIRAKNEAGKVTVTFQGVTKTFTKGAREAAQAFSEMSQELGLDKLNDAKMKTLEGRASNLGDQADRITRLVGNLMVPFFNAALEIAAGFLGVVDGIVTQFSQWAGIMSAATGDVAAFNEQQRKVIDYEAKLAPLLKRYETLKNQASLNAKEQEELRKVIDQIQQLVPNAATGFDKYGRALDINTGKVHEFIKAQKQMADQMRREAQESIAEERERLLKEKKRIEKELKDGYVDNYSATTGGIVHTPITLTPEAILERQRRLAELEKRRKELAEQRRALRQGRITESGDLEYGEPKPIAPAAEIDTKAIEARKKALLDAQKDLQNEIAKLEKEYGKERLESMKKDGLAYIKEKKKLRLLEIDEEEKALLTLTQLAAGAAKGKFDKDNKPIADTSAALDPKTKGILDARRQMVRDASHLEEIEFISAAERKLTHELSNEYQRQLQDVEYKYEELYKLAEIDADKRKKLEIQKQKELQKIEFERNMKFLGEAEETETARAEINLIEAQAKARIDLELEARRKLLLVERKYQLERMALIEDSGDEEAQKRIESIRAMIAKIDAEIRAVDKDKERITLFQKMLYKAGLNDEDIPKLKEFAQQFMGVLNELYQNQLQLSQQRVERLTAEIDKRKEQVDREKELNEQGLANNLDLRQRELEVLQKQRERAQKDQERLQKIQIASDSIMQASQLITASTKIYNSLSMLGPVGVGLAIASIATMFGTFAAAKVKAFQLAKEAPKFKHGGQARGKLHSEGGINVEVEDREWIINRRSSMKYADLLDAINQNKEGAILDYLVKDALGGTGVSEAERTDSVRLVREYQSATARQENEQIKLLQQVNERLEAIEKGTNRIPEEQMIGLGENKYLTKKGNVTVVRELPVAE
ncbi:hypothetical protein HNQ92_003177 [Rhabdobacter roseus]|uniref:Uncharacterized protein n=1 Tax=Rhabdobacter roseus TaxID=1655419 RepID=A0A840TZG7_9BACT|nr:hypothetical protein [Rhabdobacter roseus]MBB5285029.1 hypothetical protein [Rhabdobacter roseus]